MQLVQLQPKYCSNLPILEHREKIIELLKSNQVIIVAGETGSGKTTQLPIICVEAGRGVQGKIGCTQPRRIAATSIAARVAQELNCPLGQAVGYKIRFSDMDSSDTVIKFMTDGILLTEIERDPLLRMYDTLIIDEAHERSLNIDFILGFLRKLLPKRPDLKLIISSATIDTALFSKSFNNAPVIEVSGRVYPVEVLYLDPLDEDKDDEIDYVNAAVKAMNDLIDVYGSGDMLIFMPTERDIRETCDKLNGMRLNNTLILPLFSRLSRSEQEQIFKSSWQRKIVVATNIAETSITVPGIRFVIDTGLARISRYISRLRTNRLPIELISQAAAQQRMGRCGRVMDGVCIRLYSEKDFLGREQYTMPEIKRANLAGVVLSMVAHHLGNIEEFPFLEPPSKQAINEAYAQLRELGALDTQNNLTSLGKEMSFLPLDPHIARMVIAARKENAIREIKIIASALSIVDPRERPFDKQAEADAMHKKFYDPQSDFLMYVILWDTYQKEWANLKTQNKMRKFCKEHFLSYVRMQEWHDVYQQLNDTLRSLHGFVDNHQCATYDAIHKALLSGLLSNCAVKGDDGRYTAARGRDVIIFPGSSISGKKVDWIMCHEIVETSQIFARTVAAIKPQWLEEIGSHLCSRSYSEPYFDTESGIVKADEQVTLFGLPITKHTGIRYGKINSVKATDVFIWKGLVEESLNCHHSFYNHNKEIRREIEKTEAKLRTRSLFAGEQAIFEFYQRKLCDVSSIHDLNRVIKEHKNDQFLYMNREDILAEAIPEEASYVPDKVSIGGKSFPLKYAFSPGAEIDGATLSLSECDAPFIPGTSLGWLLPHLWPDRISELLQSLPKEMRKKLMPINEKARDIAAVLKMEAEPFHVSVAKTAKVLFGIEINPEMFSQEKLSPHLSVRVEIFDKNGKIISAGRGESVLKDQVILKNDFANSAWEIAIKPYEKTGITEWNFGDLAETIEIASAKDGIPLYGYPALKINNNCVDLIIARSAEDAKQIHTKGVKHLLEMTISSEFIWIERDLRFSQQLKLQCTPFGGAEKVKSALLILIKKHLLTIPDPLPYKQAEFEAKVALVKKQSSGIGYEVLSLFEKIIQFYQTNLSRISKESRSTMHELIDYLKAELKIYLDDIFNARITFDSFRQYPRYLKAFGFRIERAFNEPQKFRDKRAVLEKYQEKLKEIVEKAKGRNEEEAMELKAMIEEYAISLFAQQEVKTLYSISEKRLERRVEEIRGGMEGR